MSLNFIVIPVSCDEALIAPPQNRPNSKIDLFARAKAIYQFRRRRARHLAPNLWAEPGWDILLFLYHMEGEKKSVSISSASLAGDVPPTTGLRWISVLERQKLVSRIADVDDKRRTYLKLSEKGRSAMEAILSESL